MLRTLGLLRRGEEGAGQEQQGRGLLGEGSQLRHQSWDNQQGDLKPQHHLGPFCSPPLTFPASGSLCFPLTGHCPSRGCLSLPALGTMFCPSARGLWRIHTSNTGRQWLASCSLGKRVGLEGVALSAASHPPDPREWVRLREVVS